MTLFFRERERDVRVGMLGARVDWDSGLQEVARVVFAVGGS